MLTQTGMTQHIVQRSRQKRKEEDKEEREREKKVYTKTKLLTLIGLLPVASLFNVRFRKEPIPVTNNK